MNVVLIFHCGEKSYSPAAYNLPLQYFTLILRFSPPQITMPNTTLDKATDFVKFRDRISLFTKELRLAQYADGSTMTIA